MADQLPQSAKRPLIQILLFLAGLGAGIGVDQGFLAQGDVDLVKSVLQEELCKPAAEPAEPAAPAPAEPAAEPVEPAAEPASE